MKQIIKTIDGNRYEFSEFGHYDVRERFGEYYLRVETEKEVKYINTRNIVSITEIKGEGG